MFNKLKDCVVTNKNVFLRADMNVPMKNGKILDDTRIQNTIPTIKYLLRNEAKVILATHLGRPKGERKKEFSVKNLVPRIKKLLPGVKVNFSEDCVGDQTRQDVKDTNYGEMIVLENLRFHKEEKENNEKFAQELASFANLYINEAFSCCHRKHASIAGIPEILKGCPGFSLEKELENLENLVSSPKKPLMIIVGGLKFSTKVEILQNLVEKADCITVTGGIANTFFYALGKKVGKSWVEPDLKDEALKLLNLAKEKNCKILLPEDVIVAGEIKEGEKVKNVITDKISDNDIIVDTGTQTIEKIKTELTKCKTVIWNGPIGIYETKPFNSGTDSLATIITNLTESGRIKSVAGGGDMLTALKSNGLDKKFTYVSTAGGAFLKWLENGTLVGVEKLKNQRIK